jgi:uncharacterized protein YlxP (DUF503 family)
MIGLLEIGLLNSASHSLKDKRRDLSSLMQKIHNEFNVSAAEIEGQDTWQRTKLAIVVVSNDARHNNQVLERIVERIRNRHLEWQLLDYEIQEVY